MEALAPRYVTIPLLDTNRDRSKQGAPAPRVALVAATNLSTARPLSDRRVDRAAMPLMPDDSQGAALSDTSGPINALEADRFCEELRSFEFSEMGDRKWISQHEFLTKLNLQAHVNASQQRDEFVLEAMILHELS